MNERIIGKWPVSVGAVVVTICLSSAGVAQTTADADTITEVVVTAQKRAERVQDIPISVSAISSQDMDRAGAGDFHDLLLSIPGVSFSSSEPGQSRYSIRGISTAASSPTAAALPSSERRGRRPRGAPCSRVPSSTAPAATRPSSPAR